MAAQKYTPKYKRGDSVATRRLPEGWAEDTEHYGAITPTFGQWKGTPMMPDSNMAMLLGWPDRCLGDIKYCYRYPDGSEAVPIFKDGVIIGRKRKSIKDSTDPPSLKAQGGWIETGLIELAWTDYDGNKVKFTCRQRKRLSRGNTDRATRVLAKKHRPSY